MVRVAVTGASGLVGEYLLRLLVGHPEVELTYLSSNSSAGQPVSDVLPPLQGQLAIDFLAPKPDEIAQAADVAILAHKSSESLELAPQLLDAGLKIIDIGGEFRLKDPGLYRQWYGQEHTQPVLLAEAVYGLPELYREQIRSARIVANPGCYPTSVLIPLVPLLLGGLIDPAGIRVSSASGLTGAGRTSGKLFIDVNEDMRAYAVAGHRHRPEMEQELAAATGQDVRLTFVPHLIPVNRGILSTVFAQPTAGTDPASLRRALAGAYAEEHYVRVRHSGTDVRLAHVVGTNYCDIAVECQKESDGVLVFSALDNMLKGACSQAVQNMNLMFDLDESAGIGGLGAC